MAALNRRHGRKNPSIPVRPRCGHPGRLRPDRRRQRSGPCRADLSHPDLTSRGSCLSLRVGLPAGQKVQPQRKFGRESSFGLVGAREKPSSTRPASPRISQCSLCESGIRHLAASAFLGTGALSAPYICLQSPRNPQHVWKANRCAPRESLPPSFLNGDSREGCRLTHHGMWNATCQKRKTGKRFV